MIFRLILIMLIAIFGCAFTCNAQTQPSAAVPTEESLKAQCNDLLAARGYVATSQAGIWDRTINGITEAWKVYNINVTVPNKAGEPYYGFILLQQYAPTDPNAHGSLTEAFYWQDATRIWIPLTPNVVVSP
jgi:hypothetical protein